MERNKALAIWDAIYGNKEWAVDCYGTWMNRNDHGDQTKKRIRPNGDGKLHNYGWEIDHIRPICDFDKESDANINNNYEPVYWEHNREKADNYPHFTIGNQRYEVVKCNICKSHGILGYGIQDDNGERIDWKWKNNKYFTKN